MIDSLSLPKETSTVLGAVYRDLYIISLLYSSQALNTRAEDLYTTLAAGGMHALAYTTLLFLCISSQLELVRYANDSDSYHFWVENGLKPFKLRGLTLRLRKIILRFSSELED